MTRLSDSALDDIARWARDTDLPQGPIVLLAIIELQERRTFDRVHFNATTGGSAAEVPATTRGQRRRK